MAQTPRPDEEYNSWTDIEYTNIEPRKDHQNDFGPEESLTDVFSREERKANRVEDRKEKALNKLQREVERELHEEDIFIAYGILGGEVFPAFVDVSGDTYANEDWFNSKAEEMIGVEYFVEESEATGSDILEGMKVGIPEDIGEYAEEILNESEFDGYEWQEADKTYIMPKLNLWQYSKLQSNE